MYKIILSLGFCLACAAQAAEGVNPLVDTNWVKDHSCQPGVVVLDIRNRVDGGSKADYLQAHIPCAVYTDYSKDGWRVKINDVRGKLPPAEQLAKLIGGLGIDNNTHVVIAHAGISASDMGSATRIYWTFKVAGHDKVSILDGGFAAYAADKQNPLEKGEVKPEPKDFAVNLRQDMLVGVEDVKAALEQGVTLVDMRDPDQFLGINKSGSVKRHGTLPGAINLPNAWLTENNGGTFRKPETLQQLYEYAQLSSGGEQIYFCNTGHLATIGWFANSELLGNENAKMFDGSMAEWSRAEDAPMDAKIQVK